MEKDAKLNKLISHFVKTLPVTKIPTYEDFFYKGKFVKTTKDVVIESNGTIIPKGTVFVISNFDKEEGLVDIAFKVDDDKVGIYNFSVILMIETTEEIYCPVEITADILE